MSVFNVFTSIQTPLKGEGADSLPLEGEGGYNQRLGWRFLPA